MTRKLTKLLAVLGIGGFSLFQAGSCDYLAEQFVRGFEIGYNGGDIEDLFDTDDAWDAYSDSWGC